MKLFIRILYIQILGVGSRRFIQSSTTDSFDEGSSKNDMPYPIKLALVGTSTILATPVFMYGGVLYIWYRYLPRQIGDSYRIITLAMLGGGMAKILRDFVIPYLTQHADIVLPFAVSNGLTAVFW